MADVVLRDLDAYLGRFNPDKIRAVAKLALATAIQEYKTKKGFPGLAARFMVSAYQDYGFSHRLTRRGNRIMLDPYVASGSMRSEVMRRKPTFSGSGSELVAHMSINARVLNFLKNIYPTAYITTSKVTEVKTRGPFTRMVGTKSVDVRAHQAIFHKKTYERKKKTQSYAQEWALRTQEIQWLQRRSQELLRIGIAEVAFTKSGKPRKGFILQEAA